MVMIHVHLPGLRMCLVFLFRNQALESDVALKAAVRGKLDKLSSSNATRLSEKQFEVCVGKIS